MGREYDITRDLTRTMKHYGEVKIVTLRETPPGEVLDEPEKVVAYYRRHVMPLPEYRPEQEQLHVIMLNTRRRCIGHTLVALGTLSDVTVHAREIFRAAIVAAAHAVVLVHNHPSGDPTPSTEDVRVTRKIQQAGAVLAIEVCDHLVISSAHRTGRKAWRSMRELGQMQ